MTDSGRVVGRVRNCALALLLSGASCSVTPDAYVSFADRLRAENVRSAAPSDLPPNSEWAFIDDGSFGQDPPLGARKITRGRYVWSGLSASPGSSYRFPLRIGPSSVLEFGHVCIPGAGGPRTRRVPLRGSVTLVGSLSTRTLFSVSWVCTEANAREVRFEKIRIPEGAPARATLVFATASTDSPTRSGTPIWIAPHLYSELTRPRNVVLISLDTVRPDFLDVYGHRPALTPHLAKLAADAVVFENAFSQSSWTIPSHASLLTGCNPAVHQTATLQSRLPPDVPFLPVLLKERGYATLALAAGALSYRHGFSRGFDLYLAQDATRFEPDSTGELFRNARQLIAANEHKRIFLFLHAMQAHGPLQSPPDILKAFFPGRPALSKRVPLDTLVGGRRKYRPLSGAMLADIRDHYAAEIRTIDEHLVGPLLRMLEQEGLYEETLLIVTADHGEEFFEHGGWQHCHSVYNEIVRVPLLVKLPRRAFAGRRVEANVRLIDVLPTIMESVGGAVPPGIDGASLLPLLEGREKAPRVCISDSLPIPDRPWFQRKTAITYGRHKLIANAPLADWRSYLDFPPPPRPALELYDLEADPHELRNVLSANEATARALSEMLLEYRRHERAPGPEVEMDGETREQLRRLGYLE